MPLNTIEDIILQQDIRNMVALRPHLPESFVTDAAQLIMENQGRALIATGFYILRAQAPETDGPPGARAIANALKELGFEVGFVTDQWSKNAVDELAEGDQVIEFPTTSHRESAEFAQSVIHDFEPTVLISIERAGLVGDGTYRNFRGVDFSDYNAKIDHLFDQHPWSVGIGDGGNEIGMGNLRKVIPGLDKLPADPCVTTTTKLIIAACSNWGGYGLVAALSLLNGRNLLPSVDQGKQWVKDIVAVGAVEGMSGERKEWVDNRPLDDDAVCLRDLHDLLKAEGM